MHDDRGGGVAEGGGHLRKGRHPVLFLVQKTSAQPQSPSHRGVPFVGRTKGSEMSYLPERLPPKFRHSFA